MRNINITNKISPTRIKELSALINRTIAFIQVGGDFGIAGAYDPAAFDQIKYIGNEIAIVTKLANHKVLELSAMSTLAGQEDYGEYDHLHLKTFDYDPKALQSLEITQRMLVKNRGIFTLSVPNDLTISKIDIYSIKVRNHLNSDPDFPEEDAVMNVDLDILLKFETNQNFSFTVHAKNGKMLLDFYQNEDTFNQYISLTQNSWGELYSYQHKMTIPN